VDVVAPNPGPKPEPVSARLKRALVHPNKAGTLVSVQYSPDGKRVIAGDYPGGVLQVWDAETGRQLDKVETGYGYRSSAEYFYLSPDQRTVYVARIKRKATRTEQGGKTQVRLEYDGDVRAWDLATGKLRRTYRHTPPRGVVDMQLSPDGATFLTSEFQSDDSKRGWRRRGSVWDVKTGRSRPLPDGLGALVYAPDSKAVAAVALTDANLATAVKVFDAATGREKVSIPVGVKGVAVGYTAFSPDGKLLVGELRDYTTGRHWLKFWDVAAGREAASFEGEKKAYFMRPVFSPGGKRLAVTDSRGEESKLYLFDVPGKKLLRTVSLARKTANCRAHGGDPAFRPDGKWLAVVTRLIPDDVRGGGDLNVEDVPQPRIHLVEVAAGAVRETLVAPPGFGMSACFSPDGKTLATSGHGRVLLWDLTRPRLTRRAPK
jgi:WD40 repeat protein